MNFDIDERRRGVATGGGGLGARSPHKFPNIFFFFCLSLFFSSADYFGGGGGGLVSLKCKLMSKCCCPPRKIQGPPQHTYILLCRTYDINYVVRTYDLLCRTYDLNACMVIIQSLCVQRGHEATAKHSSISSGF